MKIIDLSIELSKSTGVYPGDPDIKVEQALDIDKDSVNVKKLALSTHHGTHIDVASHQVKAGKTLDDFSLKSFTNLNVFKIDIIEYDSEKYGIPYKRVITKQDLEQYEDQLKDKDGIIINSGYGKIILAVANEKDKKIDKEFPYLTEEAANYLCSFNLKLIGIDSVTVDEYRKNNVHQLLFKKNKDLVILETLVNLDTLPENFILNCVPLKIKNADGSPVRAYAVVE